MYTLGVPCGIANVHTSAHHEKRTCERAREENAGGAVQVPAREDHAEDDTSTRRRHRQPGVTSRPLSGKRERRQQKEREKRRNAW